MSVLLLLALLLAVPVFFVGIRLWFQLRKPWNQPGTLQIHDFDGNIETITPIIAVDINNDILTAVAQAYSYKQKDDAAEQTARDLLRRLLSPEQLQQWTATGRFLLHLRDGTVVRLGSGRVEWGRGISQCVHPRGSSFVGGDLPPTDSVITQLLYLKNEPEAVTALTLRNIM